MSYIVPFFFLVQVLKTSFRFTGFMNFLNLLFRENGERGTVVPPLSMGHMFQDPQWMPETANNIKPDKYYVLSYTQIPMIKFNL